MNIRNQIKKLVGEFVKLQQDYSADCVAATTILDQHRATFTQILKNNVRDIKGGESALAQLNFDFPTLSYHYAIALTLQFVPIHQKDEFNIGNFLNAILTSISDANNATALKSMGYITTIKPVISLILDKWQPTENFVFTGASHRSAGKLSHRSALTSSIEAPKSFLMTLLSLCSAMKNKLEDFIRDEATDEEIAITLKHIELAKSIERKLFRVLDKFNAIPLIEMNIKTSSNKITRAIKRINQKVSAAKSNSSLPSVTLNSHFDEDFLSQVYNTVRPDLLELHEDREIARLVEIANEMHAEDSNVDLAEDNNDIYDIAPSSTSTELSAAAAALPVPALTAATVSAAGVSAATSPLSLPALTASVMPAPELKVPASFPTFTDSLIFATASAISPRLFAAPVPAVSTMPSVSTETTTHSGTAATSATSATVILHTTAANISSASDAVTKTTDRAPAKPEKMPSTLSTILIDILIHHSSMLENYLTQITSYDATIKKQVTDISSYKTTYDNLCDQYKKLSLNKSVTDVFSLQPHNSIIVPLDTLKFADELKQNIKRITAFIHQLRNADESSHLATFAEFELTQPALSQLQTNVSTHIATLKSNADSLVNEHIELIDKSAALLKLNQELEILQSKKSAYTHTSVVNPTSSFKR